MSGAREARAAEGADVPLFTIGYEGANVRQLQRALVGARVALLVDVRAAARSRRVGFAKSRLAANLHAVGIEYLHLPELGTPADGRAAARAGDYQTMRAIFAEHLASDRAQAGLDHVAALLDAGHRLALLCFEALPAHCHRLLVAEALVRRRGGALVHLAPHELPPDDEELEAE